VIRVERLRLGATPQDNMLELPLLTSMYLGDRWEYLFRTGDDFDSRLWFALRDTEHCHLTFPANDLWIFPRKPYPARWHTASILCPSGAITKAA
jgi:iron(III) transport system ATP-binding protein